MHFVRSHSNRLFRGNCAHHQQISRKILHNLKSDSSLFTVNHSIIRQLSSAFCMCLCSRQVATNYFHLVAVYVQFGRSHLRFIHCFDADFGWEEPSDLWNERAKQFYIRTTYTDRDIKENCDGRRKMRVECVSNGKWHGTSEKCETTRNEAQMNGEKDRF